MKLKFALNITIEKLKIDLINRKKFDNTLLNITVL
jgi:hypothetical protein